jgi:two-component system chemotaxis response regulator CheB
MIDVLIVDDSFFMRTVLSDIISADSELRVIGSASNGKEALELIPKLKPDIVTLDIEMPVIGGLSTLEEIMKTNPIPVIMISALTQEGAKSTIDALDMGALDYIAKPSNSTQITTIKKELIDKLKTYSKIKVQSRKKKNENRKKVTTSLRNSNKIITIGASTGGPTALNEVLSGLPKDIPPTMVVQHMPQYFTKYFARRLDKLASFEVKEAEEGDRLEEGLCLLAPGNWHMNVTKTNRIHLHKGPPMYNLRPTVDEMMISAAEIYGKRTLGVILTGMGEDGKKGMSKIKQNNGVNIAQDRETSVVFGMPKAAIDAGVVDVVLPLEKISNEIIDRCR